MPAAREMNPGNAGDRVIMDVLPGAVSTGKPLAD
jgi:hypothetical protein